MSSEPWWPALFKPGIKRLVVPTVLLLIWAADALVATSPPTMVRQPHQEQLFQVPSSPGDHHRPFVLECQAEGGPDPDYKWTKNNKRFDNETYDERISRQPGRGSLVFTAPEDGDEGLYQCHATNEFGTSLSNVVALRKAQLNSFPDEDIKDVSVKEGEPFSLHCDPPTGYPRPRVSWVIQYQSGALRTINSSRITTDPDGGLHFSRADLGDAVVDGVYACSVISSFLYEYKLGNKIRLHVEPVPNAEMLEVAPVKQYLSPENIVALRGSELRLHCIYGGTPLPVYFWSKDGMEPFSPRVTNGNSGKTLIIRRVEFEDEGTYECRVDNGVGAVLSHAMHVKVEAAPYWLNAPNNTDAAHGERVVFKCDSMGVPEPNLEWFVNGMPISNAEPNPRRTVLGSMLTVESLERRDTAVYQCNASNLHGYAFRDFYLNVQAFPPTIAEGPDNVTTVVIRSNVTLRCRALGAPRPHVMWVKDGRPLTGGRYLVLDSGDLQLSDVHFEDRGEYTCLARNKFGEASASGTLDVQRRTRIISRPEDLKVAVGKTAMFRCGAETDPQRELSVEWLFNGKLLDLDVDPRLVVQGDNTLVVTLSSSPDAGIYTCLARTRLDYDRADATLVVQGNKYSSADPSFSTSKPAEQDDPLEAYASAQQPLIDAVQRTRADMLACHERAMDQNQRYSSALLAALDRQTRALEELKVAVQNGFAELQRSQRRSLQPPAEPSAGPAT